MTSTMQPRPTGQEERFTRVHETLTDNSNTGRSNLGFGANDRPHVLRNPNLDTPTPNRWFDTTAFAVPARGNFGNAGRNIVDGPGYRSLNLSLIKNTPLPDRATLQFRAEVFNVENRPKLREAR
jgi:hypothetical protein